MILARLERRSTGAEGTFGRLALPDGRAWFSGELPWKDNAPNVSCIPPGRYRCVFSLSPRFRRRLYLVDGVPARAGIRFHGANYMGDAALGLRCHLNGCIALGERLGVMDGQKALLLSQPAISAFERALGGAEFDLEILGEV